MTFFKRVKKTHPNFYSIFIGISIIMFWRGLWGLMDLYLFPDNHLLSYLVSVFLGLFLLYINDFRLKEIEI